MKGFVKLNLDELEKVNGGKGKKQKKVKGGIIAYGTQPPTNVAIA